MSKAEWIIGVATATALALGGWGVKTTASNDTRISVNEERTSNLKEQLNKIDEKVDKLLDRIPPRPEWRSDRPAPRRTETP